MGAEQGKLDTNKMYDIFTFYYDIRCLTFIFRGSLLRQSISRINIHRGKRMNQIAKKKDDICKHLASGNEMNAKIWVS